MRDTCSARVILSRARVPVTTRSACMERERERERERESERGSVFEKEICIEGQFSPSSHTHTHSLGWRVWKSPRQRQWLR